jgi:hypothetical protein
MTKAKPDIEVLKQYWSEHLPYELEMLRSTHAYLSLPHGRVIDNALIESFCIHARNLIHFYRGKDDVQASHFTKSRTYKVKHVGAHQPDIGTLLYNKLNRQIAHMTNSRTIVLTDKIGIEDRDKLLNAIEQETKIFEAAVDGTFRSSVDSRTLLSTNETGGLCQPAASSAGQQRLQWQNSKSDIIKSK